MMIQITTENPETDISPKNHISRFRQFHSDISHTHTLVKYTHREALVSKYKVEGSATVQEGDILTCTHGKEGQAPRMSIHLPRDFPTVQCTLCGFF